jgi:hypothetical protein
VVYVWSLTEEEEMPAKETKMVEPFYRKQKCLFRVTAVHRICILPPGLSNYSVPIGLTQTDTCYVAIFAQKVSYYFPLENA